MMQVRSTLANNKAFITLTVGAVLLATLFVQAVVDTNERQTRFLEIRLDRINPPPETVHLYAQKKEFDQRYELERWWGFDHIEYLRNIFVPYQTLVYLGEKKGITATPDEVRRRKQEELMVSGMTQDEWKRKVLEKEVTDNDEYRLFEQKVVAEKLMDQGIPIDLSDREVENFYERFLKNSSAWKNRSPSGPDIQLLASRYKKLSIVGEVIFIGEYRKIIFTVQQMYLCQKSS